MQDKLPGWIVWVTPDNFKEQMTKITSAAMLMPAPELGFDTETTGLKAARDDIRLMQVSDGTTAWVMDTWMIGMDKIVPWLEEWRNMQVTLIAHNAPFDMGFLLKYKMRYWLPFNGNRGVSLDERARRKWCEVFDTMIAVQAIECGLRGYGFKLNEVLERVLDIQMSKELQRSDWSAMELSPEQIEYAARDTLYMRELRHLLDEVIEENGLVDLIYRVEMPCLAATAWMTTRGLRVNREENRRLKSVLEEHAVRELENFHQLMGRTDRPINLNSPKQVTEAFAQIGIFLKSTAKDTVEKLEHPAGKSLSRYRSLSKMITSYCNSLEHPDVVDPITDLSYPNLKQNGAESGRYTGSATAEDSDTGKKIKGFNWQGIPRDDSMQDTGESFRGLIIAPDGEEVIDADYAQIELRLMAIWSKDEKMCSAMESGADLHGDTAINVFQANPDGADWKWWRSLAKRFNFAVANGVQHKKLAAMSEGRLSLSTAKDRITAWFAYYDGLATWFKENGDSSVRLGYSLTMMGRRRYYPNNMFPEDTYREGNSTSIQGSSADLTKLALGAVIRDGWDPDLGEACDTLDPRLPVHDEILMYAPKERSKDHSVRLERCMIGAALELVKRHPDAAWDRVAILADAGIGPSWAEAKA